MARRMEPALRSLVVLASLELLGMGLTSAMVADPGHRPARKVAELMRVSVERNRRLCASTEVLKARPAFIPLPPGAVKPAGWRLGGCGRRRDHRASRRAARSILLRLAGQGVGRARSP
jgi:hypothetical protein